MKKDKERNLDKKFRHLLAPSAAEIWTKHLPSNSTKGRRFLPSKRNALIVCLILKFSLSLWLGWDCHWFQKYAGDFFVGFDSKPIWFYMNIANIVVFIQDLLIPKICNKYFDVEWFEVFKSVSGRNSLKNLEIRCERRLLKFLKISRIVFFGLEQSHLPGYFVGIGFALLFAWKYQTFEVIGLALVWGGPYIAWAAPATRQFILVPAYFGLFCLYASFRFQSLSETLKSMASRQMAGNSLESQALTLIRIRKLLESQHRLVEQIRSCNRLYRHVTAVFIPMGAFGVLATIFGFQDGKGMAGKVFIAIVGLGAFASLSVYFVAAGMVSRAVKRCRLAWTSAKFCFSAQPQNHSNSRLSLRTQLKLLSVLEHLTSKRNKVGFSCLHWFALSNFTFLKALAFWSSWYFFLINFSRSL